jgi:hypothetical protein
MHIYSPYIPRVLPTDESCTCYNVGMAKSMLIEVVPLAKYLGVPVAWLRAEAEQGRLPCVNAGGVLLFNLRAVKRTLAERAARIESPLERTPV